MSLAIESICTAIAALTISGVTIYDLDEFPNEVKDRGAVLMPKPDGFITDIQVSRDSFSGLKTVTYDLHYMLYGGEVGQGRKVAEGWSSMIGNLCDVLDTIITNDSLSQAIEFEPQDVTNIGPVVDPSGKTHHGAELVFSVKEFIN